jgi:hypothetical protein
MKSHAFWLAAGFFAIACGGSRTLAETSAAAPPITPASAGVASSAAPPSIAASPDASGREGAPLPQTEKLAPAAKSDALPSSLSVAKVHSDGRHYTLDAKGPAAVVVGGKAELEIVLAAKDGYHMNDQYPYKLHVSADPPTVVTFEQTELARGDGVFAKEGARWKVRFAGAHAGQVKIATAMALSVCTKKECVIDKVELELPVTVK